MKNFIKFLKTDIKIINSYFLLAVILIILISIGYSSYALFSFTKTSNNIIEATVGIIGDAVETQTYTYVSGTNYYIYEVPVTGYYKLGAYGAQGGSYDESYAAGGLGGYSTGVVKLTKGDKLYVYVGGKGEYGTSTTLTEVNGGGYNGGGNAAYHGGGGGGASDIRYFSTTPTEDDLVWNSTTGLNSRLIVAGGGGGAYAYSSTYKAVGGAGGGTTGKDGSYTNYTTYIGHGGTPTAGGSDGTVKSSSDAYSGTSGSFGIGGNTGRARSTSYPSNGAGGGGFYGGGGADNGTLRNAAAGGGGGSGYVWTRDTASNYTTSTLPTSMYLQGAYTEQNVRTGNGEVLISYLGENYEVKDISGANAPVLASNMIPVYYDETNDVWRKADSTNSNGNYKWYNYTNKMWANAVTVKSTNRSTYLNAEPGTTISMDDINTMWVWIPRFNATTPSNYNGGTKDNPGAINVTFVKANETALDAFTFGDKNLSGFWYAKFETSHTTLASSTTNNNLGCTKEKCSNANGLIVKPSVTSLRYNNVSNFFFASRSMEQTGNSFGFVSSEVDTHMSKNNEWGAVAYLTQSIYGRCSSSTSCTEVYINNSKGYYTGRSGGNVGGKTPINGTYTDQTSTTNNTAYGFYTYDDYLLNYNTNTKGNKVEGKGTGASTTGTIYGIYDMSGGADEYVTGVFADTNGNPRSGKDTSSNSGFTGMLDDGTTYTGVSFPASKYYNLYTSSSYIGHALTETKNWYSDSVSFVWSYTPWFVRGGGYFSETSAHVFNFSSENGSATDYSGLRLVITNE